jgi:non-specific serine/threonine protein kinase
LEAAEKVGACVDVRAEEVLDLLGRLVGQSLVVVEAREDGATRYRMLEPVRQYARRLLEEGGEFEQVAGRHAEYHLQLAERTAPDRMGLHQVEWLERLEAEHDNLWGALRWALEREGDPAGAALGLRLAVAMWWYWEVRSDLTEGRTWLERALSGAADAPLPLRAEALYGLGVFAIRQGDYAAGDAAFEESLTLWRALGDEQGIARSLTFVGEVALRRGELARARALLDESLALYRALDDRPGIARALNLAGLVARDAGDYGQARALLEESLALMRALGRPWGVVIATSNLGNLALRQGDAARAAALLGEGLRLSLELGAKWSIAYSLEGLAGVAAGRGDRAEVERAARLWGAAEALREAIAAPLPPNLLPHHQELVAAARARADGPAWAAAWAAGRTLPLEEVVAEALQESLDPEPPAGVG